MNQPASEPARCSVPEARARILADIAPITTIETVPVMQAPGRVLAEPVYSAVPIPPFDAAAMDGYALAHASLAPAGESIVMPIGQALAGHPFAGMVTAGTCVRIATGAPLPAGADTVVMVEATRTIGQGVAIATGQRQGQHCRRRGEILAAGAPALAPGVRLGPVEIGLAASLGVTQLHVRRRPRVAVLSTGDELGAPSEAGGIRDSNRPALTVAITRMGGELIDLGVVADRRDQLERALRAVAGHVDVIVSSGGASVGEADHVRAVLDQLGRVRFWQVAMKPGKPLAFGHIGDAVFFALPGNPVAAWISFLQFVRPAMSRLSGLESSGDGPAWSLPCTAALGKQVGRTEFVPGRLLARSDTWWVQPAGRDVASLVTLAGADCLIELDPSRGEVMPGEHVAVRRFSDLDLVPSLTG
ncbi:MAG: molybdopterin molybdotransferase MoeA [Rhodocyclaceae bacterium]|nr:molybdopterin molybdotransferase MoeA [Rhodocyclaceae bacterium]